MHKSHELQTSLLYPEHIFFFYTYNDVQYQRWTQNHQEYESNDQRNLERVDEKVSKLKLNGAASLRG